MTNSTKIDIYDYLPLMDVFHRIPKELREKLIANAATKNITLESISRGLTRYTSVAKASYHSLFQSLLPGYWNNTYALEVRFLILCLRSPISVKFQLEIPDFPKLKPKMSLRDWYCRNERYEKVMSMFNKKGIFPDEDDFIITFL